jgi:N-acetylneuraminic acid mutarotase
VAADPSERDAACFAGIAGRLYVAGGYGDDGTTLDVAEAYSLKTDSWATLASMPQTPNTRSKTTNGLSPKTYAIVTSC